MREDGAAQGGGSTSSQLHEIIYCLYIHCEHLDGQGNMNRKYLLGLAKGK